MRKFNKEIEKLAERAAGVHCATDALHLSQAALNLAQASSTVTHTAQEAIKLLQAEKLNVKTK